MTTKNVSVNTANLSTKQLMKEKKSTASFKNVFEKIVPTILFLFAAVSVLTTIAILYTLITEAVHFFQRVSLTEFFTSTNLKTVKSKPILWVATIIKRYALVHDDCHGRRRTYWLDGCDLLKRICE